MVGATAVAVVHAAVVVLVLSGALLALRWPRLLFLHAPVAAAVVAVYLAGAPCPLTELELALRARAGLAPYTGGFLGQYVLAPVGLDVGSPAVQAALPLVVLLPNLVGYGLLAVRAARRRRSAGPGARRDRPGTHRIESSAGGRGAAPPPARAGG
ncbi:DUF2784 domain-containing protein [Geodermatophilus sp. SYSU D00965]